MISKRTKCEDVLESVQKKYQQGQKISYEEYVILLATNDEIWFSLNNYIYQVDHGIQGFTYMFIIEFDGAKKRSERSEQFSSIIDMLHHFKVGGKKISEIWGDVTFDGVSTKSLKK